MIVGFEQDPEAPFGYGNFRDETGKATYVADPDTARRFVPTMPGSGLQQKVGAESDAIAKAAFGGAAPATGPDLRLADAGGAAPPAGPPAVPGQPAAPQTASDAGPAPSPSAPAGGKGAALVNVVNKVHPPPTQAAPASPAARLVNAATAAAPTTPRPAPSELPPVSGVSESHSRSVVKGASREGVQQRINLDNQAQNALEQQMLESGRGKDARIERAYQNEITTTKAQGSEEFGTIAEAQRKEAEAARLEALKRAELKKNDESLDPDRVIRNMSTGKKIGMVILAALNGGFGALIGQKSNGVLDVIDAEIERDIDRQKQEIASGKVRLGNEIDKYVKLGFDAQTAEKMARDRLKAAVGKVTELESKRLAVQGENAENAQLMVQQNQVGRMRWQGDLWATTEDRAQTQDQSQVQREVPKPVAGAGGLDSLMKQLQIRKLMKDEGMALDENGNIVGTGQPTPQDLERADKQIESYDTATDKLVQGQVALQNVLNIAGFRRDERGKLVPPDDIPGKGLVDAPLTEWAQKLGLTTEGTNLERSVKLLKEAFGRMQSQGAISKDELSNFDGYINAMLEGGFVQNLEQIDNLVNGIAERHLRRLGPVALSELAKRENRAVPTNRGAAVRPVTTIIPVPGAPPPPVSPALQSEEPLMSLNR